MSRSKLFLDDLCDAGGMPGFGPNYGEMPDYIDGRPEPRDDFAANKTRERVAAIQAELKTSNPPPPQVSKPARPSARNGRVVRKTDDSDCPQCGGPCSVETTRDGDRSTWRLRCPICTPA